MGLLVVLSVKKMCGVTRSVTLLISITVGLSATRTIQTRISNAVLKVIRNYVLPVLR